MESRTEDRCTDLKATGIRVICAGDAPTATNEASQNVNEGNTVTGQLDFVAGADGGSVTHIGATSLVFGGDAYSQVIDIGSGSIKVKAAASGSVPLGTPRVCQACTPNKTSSTSPTVPRCDRSLCGQLADGG